MTNSQQQQQQSTPAWRNVLAWGALTYFLGLPAIAVAGGFLHFEMNPNVAKFLADFHMTITALLGAVAGLDSWDRRGNTSK
jgi:hypothetical protein